MFGKLGSLLSFRGHDVGSQGATRKRKQGSAARSTPAVVEELEIRALLTTAPTQLLFAEPGPIFIQPGQTVPIASTAVVGHYDAEYAQLAATLAGQLTTTAVDGRFYTTNLPQSESSNPLPQTDESLDLIRSDTYYADPFFSQYNGGANGSIQGVTVVVLDSGIDLDHAFFGPDADNNGVADRIVYSYDFADGNDADASDFNGHGSNVSGIIGSSDTTYGGVANGVNLIHLKVFPDDADLGTQWSDVEEALQWIVANAATYNIVAINMSLGAGNFDPSFVPDIGVSDEFAALDALNIMSIAAAGNSFFDFGSQQGVGIPAADPNVIAVSAVWDANEGPAFWGGGAVDFTTAPDRVASFSQRHETMTAVLAPGPQSTNANWDGGTVTMGGTSQAAPHVAGAAALAQQIAIDLMGRRLTQAEFREILSTTGPLVTDGDDENDNVVNTGASWRRLDVMAMAQAVQALAVPPSVVFDPDVTVNGVTINEDGTTGALQFTVNDLQVTPGSLVVTAVSDNQLLVPNNTIILGGSGANRTITVSPRADLSGIANITVIVSNGNQEGTASFELRVMAQPEAELPRTDPLVPITTPFENLTPAPLADGGVTTSTIDVSGLDAFLYHASVTLDLEHPASGELTITLTSPTGTVVTLTSANGGLNADVFRGTTFDDHAGQPVTDWEFSDGTTVSYIIPEGALAQLLGEDPNGTWTLEITDGAAGNEGTLHEWSLALTTISAPPTIEASTQSALTPHAIPADSSQDFTIVLTDKDPFLFDMDIFVDLDFPTNGSIDLYLISPKGTTVALSTGNGGNLANIFSGTLFDDQATIPVTDEAFVGGTASALLIPEGALAQLLGENPNGTWTLRVVNRHVSNTGTLQSWRLDAETVYINDPPTLGTTLSPVAIYEDMDLNNNGVIDTQQVDLFGITAGPNETQNLRVTATSDNPGLIPHPNVNYIPNNTFGTLTYTPIANMHGIANLSIVIMDGGADNDLDTLEDNAWITRVLTVIVLPVNDLPTINTIVPNSPILEDAGLQTLTLTGISPGGGETQALQITAVSSNPLLIPHPVVEYIPGSSTADLKFAPTLNSHGNATIIVTITDAGLDGNFATTADNLSIRRTFTIVVTPVNDPPTLDAIADPPALTEDGPQQLIGLSGISAGGGEQQPLLITAESDNLTLIPGIVVNYTPGSAFGSLSFRPAANQDGVAIITVTIVDAGPDGLLSTTGDNATFTRTFAVTVNPGNDTPVFDPIPAPAAILEDAVTQFISLTGINAGPGESQPLEVTVHSSNPAVIPTPTVTYTSSDTTGFISYAPAPNAYGSSVITVLLTDGGIDGDLLTTGDNGTLTRQFLVVVTPVNDTPTIDAVPNPTAILEDAPEQTLTLTGITAGGGETQPLQITVLSGNTALIPHPTLIYTSGDSTATLQYTPVANASGTALISVLVTDGGLDGNLATAGDNASYSLSFTVTVTAVNDAPSFATLTPNPVHVAEEAGQQSLTITGITPGASEVQNLQFTVVSDNPTLIAGGSVDYTNGQTTGDLQFFVEPGQFGTAHLTVTVTDPGLDGNFATTGDNLTHVQVLTVEVAPVNDPPTLNAINALTIAEDSGLFSVGLSGITAGPNETQHLVVTASSSNTNLISNPFVSYTSPNTTGTLQMLPLANQFGTVTITVTVTDGGLDNNLATTGDNGTFQRTFDITITPTNDVPTIDAIPDPDPILEDSGEQIINMTGISAGGGESQALEIVAFSDNTDLIANVQVDYISPGVSGQLFYTPLPNVSGTATITVIVRDGGLDGDLLTIGDNGETVVTFVVEVLPVNDTPTLNQPNNLSSVPEDTSGFLQLYSGISAGAGESGSQQGLSVTVTSNNPSLLPNPQVAFTPNGSTAQAQFAPVANKSGTATITVTVMDGGDDNDLNTLGDNLSVTRTYTITIDPTNDLPTLDALPVTLDLDEDDGAQTLTVTGISAGADESQPLELTVISSDESLILNPTVTYTSPGSTATVHFQPLPDASGEVDLFFTLMDGGLDGDLTTLNDNGFTTHTLRVNIAEQPEAPKVTLDSGSLISSNGKEVILSPNALVTDDDSGSFLGSKVTVTISSGMTTADKLSLKAFGSGKEKVKVTKTGQLRLGKQVIGSVTGGTNGQPLEILFDGEVDLTANFVQLIVRNLSFQTSGKNRGLRTVQVTVTDPENNTSAPGNRFISVG